MPDPERDDLLVWSTPSLTREQVAEAMAVIRANAIPRGATVHITPGETHYHEVGDGRVGPARRL